MRGPAFFAYSDNYLIDVKFGIIMDVEASRAIRQAEVGAAKTMIERTEQRFDIKSPLASERNPTRATATWSQRDWASWRSGAMHQSPYSSCRKGDFAWALLGASNQVRQWLRYRIARSRK